MNRRVAVRGPLFSGKTTTAEALESLGFHLVSSTDSLKAMVAETLSRYGTPTSVTDIKADKERYRIFLQQFGDHIHFNEGRTYPFLMAEAFERWGEDADYVFDNVRFLAQWQALQPYGFQLVLLNLSPMDQELRAAQKGMSREALGRAMDHPGEVCFPVQPGELVLDATAPVEFNVRRILEEVHSGQEAA